MTAVSTKVSVVRGTGIGAPGHHGGGPVPIPRVVGNRRIRTGGIALATMLLAVGAALSGIALVSVAKTAAYLAVAQPVAVGSMITGPDLTTVRLAGGGGLTLIPAADVTTVVGRRAAVSLVPGSLLVPSQLTDKTLIGAGQAQIGITVRGSSLPAQHLSPGQQITLIALGASGSGSGSGLRQYVATVIDISGTGSDGTVEMHIAVPVDLAPTMVVLSATGGFAIYLKPGN
jgi:hypothetical protein